MIRRRSPAAALLLLAVLAGCGDGPERGHRASSPTTVEGAGDGLIARSLPRVSYRGGPFLRHPRIVTITFDGDNPELVSSLERFGDTITRSGWWRAVTEGYCTEAEGCIGKGSPGPHIRLAEPLPNKISDVEVGTLLARTAKTGRLPALDSETLLLVYLPEGVALGDAFFPRYCDGGPRALHRALRLERATLPYAVMPRCGSQAELTASASQEILEATTNPDPAARGFAFEQTSASVGFTSAGVEPVDPCGLISPQATTREGGFVVQRAWSNRAASLGRDPCVPAPAQRPYLALVPRQPVVRLVRRGDSATVTLDARADRPVASWNASAVDLSGSQAHERYVEVSLDRSRVSAGGTAYLTVTLRKRTPSRQSVVAIVSTLHGHSHRWPLAIVTR